MRSEVQVLLDPPRTIRRIGRVCGSDCLQSRAHSVDLAGSGALAQLGEHLLCKQRVIGSIPIGSTTLSSCLRSDSTVRPLSACERSAVQLDADFGPVLHRLERYNIRTEAPRVRGLPDGTRPAWACDSSKICFVQVKYTNRSESNLTRTKSCCEPAARFGNVCILIKATL